MSYNGGFVDEFANEGFAQETNSKVAKAKENKQVKNWTDEDLKLFAHEFPEWSLEPTKVIEEKSKKA